MAAPLDLRSKAAQDILVNISQPWGTVLTIRDKKTRQAISLVGATITMKITRQFSTPPTVYDLTIGNGLSIMGDDHNRLAVEGPPLVSGSYTYQIKIILPSAQQYTIGGSVIPGNE
jgi:hypothetical protein